MKLDAEERVRSLVRGEWGFVGRLLRHLGVRSDLDDATQIVFITFAQKASVVEPGRERAFLAGTAVHVAARYRRSVARRRAREENLSGNETDSLEGVDERNPERTLVARGALVEFDRRLQALDEDLRAVFLLHEVEEMTMREIATALGIPPGTVASRLRRARADFEGLLFSEEAGEE